jgi:hypothetical protein
MSNNVGHKPARRLGGYILAAFAVGLLIVAGVGFLTSRSTNSTQAPVTTQR